MNKQENKNTFWFEDSKKLKLKLHHLKTKSGANQSFKEMSIRGIGSKAWPSQDKTYLHLDVGYTHYISSKVPDQVSAHVKKTRMIFSSLQKRELGEFGSSIKRLKQPDPYKGKGIRYKGEEVKLKVGKVKT